MKAKKIFATLLAATMIASLVACSSDPATGAVSGNGTEGTVSAPSVLTIENPSTDFSDGLFGFLGNDKVANPSADDSVISMSEFNGSAAVKVEPQGKAPFIAIQMDAMVGDAIADVATVAVTLGVESPDGNFYAASGKIYEVLGGSKAGSSDWSIYKESANPKTVSHDLSVVPAAGDYVVVSMESDVAANEGLGQSNLYILDITFLDAAGATIAVDTAAEYAAPSSGNDRTNLFGITGAVDTGISGSNAGWQQIGYVDLSDEAYEALCTPGSVVEISYSSKSGNMWMGLNGDSWLRIGVGDVDGSGQGYAYYNNSRTISQITYEDIASVCGDDSSKWAKNIFFESDDEFEVYSVVIGQQAPSYTITNAIDTGISGSSAGWQQIGYVDLADDAYEMLCTPGSIVKIEYSAATDDIWFGLNGDAWQRVAQGDADGSGSLDAISDGSVCYVTYDMIAAVAGDDSSKWAKNVFVESDGDFEVYSVQIGMAGEVPAARNFIDTGISGSNAGWQQIGYVDLADDAYAALCTPGSVVMITYSAATDDIWFGLNGDAWQRVAQGDADGSGSLDAISDGSVCYVTYDMIAAVAGDDSSKWAKNVFVESDGDFEVYSVMIGQSK